MKTAPAILSLSLLSACATVPNMVYVRTDGRSVYETPSTAQQFEVDQTICRGEMQKSSVSQVPIYYPNTFAGHMGAGIIEGQRQNSLGDITRGCMASKGYLLRPEETAPRAAEGVAPPPDPSRCRDAYCSPSRDR